MIRAPYIGTTVTLACNRHHGWRKQAAWTKIIPVTPHILPGTLPYSYSYKGHPSSRTPAHSIGRHSHGPPARWACPCPTQTAPLRPYCLSNTRQGKESQDVAAGWLHSTKSCTPQH